MHKKLSSRAYSKALLSVILFIPVQEDCIIHFSDGLVKSG